MYCRLLALSHYDRLSITFDPTSIVTISEYFVSELISQRPA